MSAKSQTDHKGQPTGGSDSLDASTVHDLLRSERRRHVLTICANADGPVSKTELAERVARREYGHAPSDPERKRVRVALHQAHLGRLCDAGALRRVRGGYVTGPTAGELTRYLDGVNTGWLSLAVGRLVR